MTPSENDKQNQGDREPQQRRLSAGEAEQFTEYLAQATLSDLPASYGLRATAAECGRGRITDALNYLAEQLEQGCTLEDALKSSGGMLPGGVRAVLAAAARSGTLGDALLELSELQREARSLRRTVIGSFAYPLVVLCLAAALLGLLPYFLTGAYRTMFEEFGAALPVITQFLFWITGRGLIWMAAAIVLVALALAAARLWLGRGMWQQALCAMPLLGPLWQWSGVAEWSSLMAVMLNRQLPLPEALRLAADSIRNASLGQFSRQFAERAERGEALSQMLAATTAFPGELVPLVRWGEQTGALADAMIASRELFVRRVWVRSMMLQSVLPPILFVAIGCLVLFYVTALFAPLTSLISSLSG